MKGACTIEGKNGMEWTEMNWTPLTELGTPGFLVSGMFLHICY